MAERTFGGYETYEQWVRATADSLGKPSKEASVTAARRLLAIAERSKGDQGPKEHRDVPPS